MTGYVLKTIKGYGETAEAGDFLTTVGQRHETGRAFQAAAAPAQEQTRRATAKLAVKPPTL